MDDYLTISGVEPLFGAIVGVDQVDQAKPHPALLLRALELLGVDAAEAIYVGDTHVDVEAARAARMGGVFLHRSTALGAGLF